MDNRIEEFFDDEKGNDPLKCEDLSDDVESFIQECPDCVLTDIKQQNNKKEFKRSLFGFTMTVLEWLVTWEKITIRKEKKT